MAQLDTHFPIMSRESAAPLSIPRADIVAELARELHRRRDAYPARVRDGKLQPAVSEWQINIWAAIHADFEADLHLNPSDPRDWQERRARADERLAPFSWADILRELRRELSLRRRWYPQAVAEGRFTAVTARHQLERIEAVHFAYWVQARRWWPEELDHKRYQGADLTDTERQIWRDAYDRHRAHFVEIEDAPRGDYAQDAGEGRSDGWAA